MPQRSAVRVYFRPLRPRRAAAYCRLIAACAPVDQIDPRSTLESLPDLRGARLLMQFAPPGSMIGAFSRRQLVGFMRLMMWPEPGGTMIYMTHARVHPDLRGRGIGTRLMAWAEESVRRITNEGIPDNRRPILAANASSTEPDAALLLGNLGFTPAFTMAHMRLVGPLPNRASPPPAGINIRPPAAGDAPALHAAQSEAWGNELIGVAEESDDELIAEIADQIEAGETAFWRVARDGNRIAGQVWARIEEVDGAHRCDRRGQHVGGVSPARYRQRVGARRECGVCGGGLRRGAAAYRRQRPAWSQVAVSEAWI
ncbi:MAG: GNAT family N-acetyltransferase [Chloroflexi bacterium]|nr:GNAT family N-acetyltransferase [Chloroflexota bacterium]